MTTWGGPAATDRLLLVAPHPDDETLAAGGILRRALAAKARVQVLFGTDGEGNVWVERLVERRLRIDGDARARFGARRRGEAVAALSVLGVPPEDVAFLGLPDCGVTDALLRGEEAPVAALAERFASWSPTVVVFPSIADVHPDHSALGVLVRMALVRAALAVSPVLLEYVIHRPRGRPRSPGEFSIPLTPDELARKRRAILQHEAPMVAHRAGFLARAREPERFRLVAEASVGLLGHPVYRAVLEGEDLRLDLAPRARLGACGPATLHVVGRAAAGPDHSLRVDLAWRRGEAAVERGPGREVVGRARLVRRGLRGTVRLPRACLPDGASLFVKIERRHGFFDEAGWAAIPTPRAGAAAPPPTRPAPLRHVPAVCVVVPCYDVAGTCAEVVREASRIADHVIAVDDGSRDGTADALLAVAASSGGRVEVLSFPENRGKGVALIDAFRTALARRPFDLLVTLDADGQHRAADVPALVAAWRGGADLVIGARRRFERMPLRSRFGNTLTGVLLRRLYPRCPADTQSGLRALDRRFAEDVVANVRGRRYETEMHVLLLALGRGLRVESVAIPTVYLDGNRSSHFRPVVDSVRIYRALAGWWFQGARRGPAPRAASGRRG